MSEDIGADVAVATTEEVVIELDRRITTAAYRDGDTLLQTARSAGW
jgi:ferredoxin